MPQIIQALTLVDITATGVTRTGIGQDLSRNQQRNWETVLQVLSLRTQPHIINKPSRMLLTEFQVRMFFGEYFSREQAVWKFDFTADVPAAYTTDKGTLNGLIEDFKEIPIITGLEETAKFMLPIFYTQGAIKNICFVLLDHN